MIAIYTRQSIEKKDSLSIDAQTTARHKAGNMRSTLRITDFLESPLIGQAFRR